MSRRWLKGNTHAHTTNSDGDAPPDQVVAWYEDHGYDFLAISDHNVLTPPVLNRPVSLTLLPAEELTLQMHIHVNGLGLSSPILPPKLPAHIKMADEKMWILRWALEQIEAQGALAHVNHPNYNWSISSEAIEAVETIRIMEVFNGHPFANNAGSAHGSSVEAKWDKVLSDGRLVYGLATDDAHHYGTFDPVLANPGRGWIYLEAEDARTETILEAMKAGRFYASTGVKLADYDVRGGCISVAVDSETPVAVELVGEQGNVLDRQEAIEARLDVPAGQRYVRVRVQGELGERAWMQPIMRDQ